VSDISLNTSGIAAPSQAIERDAPPHGVAAKKAVQPEVNKGISNALIARVFGVSRTELEVYEASLKQNKLNKVLEAQAQLAQEADQLPASDAQAPALATAEAMASPLAFEPWRGGKPQTVQALIDFMATRGVEVDVNDAAHFLYGTVGVNEDTRDFDAILNAPDPFDANNQALGQMFHDKDFVYHGGAHPARAADAQALRIGALIFSAGRLYAQPDNGSPWVPVKLTRPGQMKSAGLARFGVTDQEARTMADNPAVSEKVRDLLRGFLGTGYDAQAAQRYSVAREVGFDLASFLKDGRQ